MKRKVSTQTTLFENVKFVQLVVRPWEREEGKQQSSLVALGDDGNAYQYYHSEKAWVPLSTDILRRV